MHLKIFTFVLCFAVFTFAKTLSDQKSDQNWWKHAIFYQIYPRSFKDSNNDGDGDLKGILEKLPHVKDAGVDALWVSPIMESPQIDQGYDISNYYVIDKKFGNMNDLKSVIERAHELGLKVILDFVPNHTSDKHEWFKASENGTEEYKDYYVWVDGTPDKPPNNWLSNFRGSVWTWSEKRQQYYLHQFLKEQPDLNYRNPKVHEEMKNILKYYMDLGIDGFRIDAMLCAYEDEQLRDEPRSYLPGVGPDEFRYLLHIYTNHMPETYELLYEWRSFVDEYVEKNGLETKVIMTEASGTFDQTIHYYGHPDGSKLGAHFCFNFFLIENFNLNVSNTQDIVRIVYNWLDLLPKIFTPNWVIGNHDSRRAATRYGPKDIDGWNMLVQLLPGVAVTYNGEEFGQEDGEVTYEEGQDPSARDPAIFEKVSRDFERTPLQWDNTTNAGFNEGAKSWLPVSEKYHELNLASQLDENELSHFQIYRKLASKRQEDPARIGTTDIWATSNDTLVLKRSHENKHIVLAFKLGWHNNTEEESILLPGLNCANGTVAITSVGSKYQIGSIVNLQDFKLQPHESVVLDVTC